MRIALLGYGKMGHEVEAVARANGDEVVARVSSSLTLLEAREAVMGAEVAIDFSTPDTAFEHVQRCIEWGIPLVCGTTGWYQHLDEAKRLVESKPGAALFVSANFSLGVALVGEMCELMARYVASHPAYRVSICETHHVAKRDAPSGTAITLAQRFVEGAPDTYRGWALEPEAGPGQLPIRSERVGSVPGTHEIVLEGPDDRIVVRHEAKNRRQFAQGAWEAARFLCHRPGFWGMADLLAAG